MVSYIQERVRRENLEQSVTAARKSVEHVTSLYKTGLIDFQDVQLMELFKLEQEDQLADSKGTVIQNLISIYRSLGGGWEPESSQIVKTK